MSGRKRFMAVDGNSLLHRSFHALAGTNLHDSYGRPTWAIKGMLNQLSQAADRVGPDALVVGFDSPGDSIRKKQYPDYKAARSVKAPELMSQLDLAPKMLSYAGFAVRSPAGLEADDVIATAARFSGENGWDCVIVTSDRDAFAHISNHTSLLRIINGGVANSPLLTPDKLELMNGIRPENYLDYAALRGDTSDNLVGVHGIGEKTAARLLSALGSMEAVWADLADGGVKVVEAAGKAARTRLLASGARAAWARNVAIMSAVTDLDLGVDLVESTGEGILPVDPGALASACHVLNFNSEQAVASLGRPRVVVHAPPRAANLAAAPAVAVIPDDLDPVAALTLF